jgi:hypothetical protein
MRVHDLGQRYGVDGILIDGINFGSHAPHHRPDDISGQPRDPVEGEQALRQHGLPNPRSAEVTAGQLDLVQRALAQPYRLDDATVARISRVHQDQADDLVLFQNQADKWNAISGLSRDQRAAVQEYEAVVGELRRLNAEVLAAAEKLKPVTIEALLTKSDLEGGH